MKIIKSKETLILTQIENAILSETLEILKAIYEKSEGGGEIEGYSDEAKNNIRFLLEKAEIEGDEPSGETKVTIII